MHFFGPNGADHALDLFFLRMPGHHRPTKTWIKCFPLSILIFSIFIQLLWPKFRSLNDSLELVPYSKIMRISHQVTRFPRLFQKSIHPKPANYDSPTYQLFQLSQPAHISKPVKAQGKLIHENKLRISIHVFAWKRSKSLRRLLNSLLEADYSSQDFVDLHFNIDGNPSPKVLKIIREFEWGFGNHHVFVHQRLQPIGLKRVNSYFILLLLRPKIV
jgi:hypothetical protein